MWAVPGGVPKRPVNARAQATTIRKSCTEGTSVATAPRLARAPQRGKCALAPPVTASLRGRRLGGDCARARSPIRNLSAPGAMALEIHAIVEGGSASEHPRPQPPATAMACGLTKPGNRRAAGDADKNEDLNRHVRVDRRVRRHPHSAERTAGSRQAQRRTRR